jgi:DNA polymerase-1
VFDVPNLHINKLIALDDVSKVVDTLIYARLAWPDVTQRKGLANLAHKLLGFDAGLGRTVALNMLGYTIAEGFFNLDIDTPAYLMDAAMDAILTAQVLPKVRDAALQTLVRGHPFTVGGVTGDDARRLLEREQVINRMLLKRACRGLRVDVDYLERYRESNDRIRSDAESLLTNVNVRVKPGNPQSLMSFLTRVGAIPDDYPRTAKTGKYSTVAANLETLDHPVARAYVQHKQITKVEKDYLQKVTAGAIDGRIHPVVNLLAATTGRMSIGDPPLHQFPEDARGIILPDENDSFVSIDWSQIEPVLAANIAQDLPVLAPYEEGAGDLYMTVAQFADVTRKQAKVVLLAQLYGEGITKLAADLGVSLETAKSIRNAIFIGMPRISQWLRKLRTIGEKYRKVFTLSGRILDIPIGTYNGVTGVQTHKAINYFVQGSAYDLLAEALVEIDRQGLGDGVYLTMHDELIVSSSIASDVQHIMETPPPQLVKLAGRVPILRTDMARLPGRWAKV